MSRRLVVFFALLAALVLACAAAYFYVTGTAAGVYGKPVYYLTPWERFKYSTSLLWYDGLLTDPIDVNGAVQTFSVDKDESVRSVASRLEERGLIRSAAAFRIYLIYAGLDTSIQAGEYDLSPALSALDIAWKMQDATPAQVTFHVLAGWRMEEVAASLPTSGLSITSEAFLAAARHPRITMDFLPSDASAEGFLFPGAYTLPRGLPAQELVRLMIQNFSLYLSRDMREGFDRQGLTVYQAVTLASIVQREAVLDEEKPLIASVFLNRLAAGMKLESDPTVQYALGYNADQGAWWTNPLSVADLDFDSPYNTYVYDGLPPGPIDNPELVSLEAVAYPAQTPYYFFRARCDGSGGHLFAETFEQHVKNACP
jgi:UPF0755 protein